MNGYNPNYLFNMQRGAPQMNRSNMKTLPSPLQYSGSQQPLRYQKQVQWNWVLKITLVTTKALRHCQILEIKLIATKHSRIIALIPA